ncbi:MAG: trypsin-like peptidase domain-containing protein [Elusimicrobia bacterium]|nr:trypsin-like peptidase domain-containing protein [Elusimicrobiota bacterium]
MKNIKIFGIIILTEFFSLNSIYSITVNKVEVIKRLRPSVVTIKLEAEKIGVKDWEQKIEAKSGTGTIIKPNGYIVTNYHVVDLSEWECDNGVKMKLNKIKVILNDNREFNAQIIGMDKATDLALIKIDADNLKPVTFIQNSDTVEVGQEAIAIGNPFELAGTVTSGMVSAVHRQLPSGGYCQFEDFIQIDTPVNPGNSGGPAIDTDGNLIGIVTAKIPSYFSEGISFVIPSNIVKQRIELLFTKKEIEDVWLGIWIENEMSSLVVKYFVDENLSKTSGLKSGDVILKINDEEINGIYNIQQKLWKIGLNVPVKLTILRDGVKYTFSVNTTKRPKVPTLKAEQVFKVWGAGFDTSNKVKLVIKDIDRYNYVQNSITFYSIKVGSYLEGKMGFELNDEIDGITKLTNRKDINERYKTAILGTSDDIITDVSSFRNSFQGAVRENYLCCIMKITNHKLDSSHICLIWQKLPGNSFI